MEELLLKLEPIMLAMNVSFLKTVKPQVARFLEVDFLDVVSQAEEGGEVSLASLALRGAGSCASRTSSSGGARASSEIQQCYL